MAKFKYKFEAIKKIKQRMEKKVQKEVAIIELEIKKKENEILILNEKIRSEKRKVLNKKSMKASELHFYSMYENYLINTIDEIKNELVHKKEERKKKLKELEEKVKETKIFEKLEEKHLQEFLIEQDKIEQLEMDEIAVKEFIKGK